MEKVESKLSHWATLMKSKLMIFAAIATLMGATSASIGSPLIVSSYDMFNGNLTGAVIDLSAEFTHSSASRHSMGYVEFSQTFVADSASTRLRFTSISGTGVGGNVLDAVSITMVPEPTTILLAVLGFAALTMLRLRRLVASSAAAWANLSMFVLSRCSRPALLAAFCLSYVCPADAAISTTGNVTPDPHTTTSNHDLIVGFSANGTMLVDAGSDVASRESQVGFFTNVIGVATVDGVGSTWTNSSELLVGYLGSGTLSVTGGGQVSNSDGYIAVQQGLASLATVSGPGSTWTNTGDLRVGNFGNGTLNIIGGGQVSDVFGYIGYYSTSTGKVTVDGTGSSWTNSQQMSVGVNGEGTLNITNGGHVSSNSNGVIGTQPGSTGTVTVDGVGSNWTTSGNLEVGRFGSASLNITGGGHVNNTTGYVVGSSGTTNVATVNGAGSTWTNSGGLLVGGNGEVTLAITGGGHVEVSSSTNVFNAGSITFANGSLTTDALLAPANRLAGTGIVNAHGLVTDVDLVFDQSHGLQQQLVLNSQPNQNITINLDVNGTEHLGAGYVGQGSLTIADGRVIASTEVTLGAGSGSTGIATVNGIGSTWIHTARLSVGANGAGSLNITNGGQVKPGPEFEGFAYEVIGGGAGSTGSVKVDGAGSTLTYRSNMYVGDSGNGMVFVTNGGHVSSLDIGPSTGNISIGNDSGSTGGVTVDGAGSTWTNSGGVDVGYSGIGTLAITGGGLVDVGTRLEERGDLNLGKYSGSAGTINLVDGILRMHGGALSKGDGAATFNFVGGRLEGVGTINLGGAFTQSGGTLAPGNSEGKTTIEGGYTLDAGKLEIDMNGVGGAGVDWDLVDVNGAVNLLGGNALADGVLDIRLGFAPALGSGFLILDNDGTDAIAGTFAGGSTIKAPYNDQLFEFAVNYTAGTGNDVGLWTQAVTVLGDYNADGAVDAADYTVWRDTLNTTANRYFGADGNGNGQVDAGDFDVWKLQFGDSAGGGSAGASPFQAPEPMTLLLVLLAAVADALMLRRRLA